MDYFIDYFIPRLMAASPEQAALVKAIAKGYKICHPDKPGGKYESGNLVSHHPCAANPLYTVPSACTEARGAASKPAENVRPSHEPLVGTNLGVCMSHVATSVFVESKDSNNERQCQEKTVKKPLIRIFTCKEILPSMQSLLNSQSFFNLLMENRDLSIYKDVWLKSGIWSRKSPDSAYTYFHPANDPTIYDVLRITDHKVVLGNVRKGTKVEVSLQFDNDDDPSDMHGKNNGGKTLNNGKTTVITWYFNHGRLRHNYHEILNGRVPGISRSYKETQIYKIFAEIQHFFETGEFNAPF